MSNDNKINKKSWTTDEDAKLLKLIDELGVSGSWTLISSRMGDRSGKQCRERYHNHLKSDINKSAFTKEEDGLVNELQLKFGNQWAKISKYFNGRSDNAVKNRWHIINRSKPTEPVVVNKKPIVPMLALNFAAPVASLTMNTFANMDLLNLYHSHCEHSHEPTLSSRSAAVPSSARSTVAWRTTVPGSDSECDEDSWMDELLSTSYSNTSDEDWSSGADDDYADDISVNSNIFDMLTITPRLESAATAVVAPKVVYDAFSEAALTQREDPKEYEYGNDDSLYEDDDCFDFNVSDSDILTLDLLEGFIASVKPSPVIKKLVNSHPRLTPRSPAFPVMTKRQRGAQPGGSPVIRM